MNKYRFIKEYTPTILTIAGSDPYGGAGIQVDCKTIHALGGYAFSVSTAQTVQSSTGVKSVHVSSVEVFKSQLEALLDDVKVDAVKIGMLANSEIVSVVVHIIDKYDLKNIVLDTVLVSSSGKELLNAEAKELMVNELFPRVDLITPNLPEINSFLKTSYVGKEDEVINIAKSFFKKGVKSILIKGGHSLDENVATDYLVSKSYEVNIVSTDRVETSHTHGTGCLLSSAIALSLAKGESLKNSVSLAKSFLYKRLNDSQNLKFNYLDKDVTRKEPLV